MNGFSGNYLQAVALLDKRVIFLIDIDKIINLPGAPPDPHRVAESVPR
jgi:chemotaxis signal transduction protein